MTANTYKVTYKDGIFKLENTVMKGGASFGDTSPDQNFTDVVNKSALDNETSIEGYLNDVEEKANILNNAIEIYNKAVNTVREHKDNQSQENNKSFDDRLNNIKEKIKKNIEGGKRKTFRKKNKKNKKGNKNNSKNKHNNRL